MSIKTLQFSNKPNICCCIWSFAFVFTIWIWITNEHKKWKKGKKMENIVKKTMKIWKNRKNIAITQTKNECELNRNILLVFFSQFPFLLRKNKRMFMFRIGDAILVYRIIWLMHLENYSQQLNRLRFQRNRK